MDFTHLSQEILSFSSLAFPIGFKVVSAILCGGAIGLEREIKNKSAGLKTNILICLGAALYTIVSILVPTAPEGISAVTYRGDVSRIAAQIVSGIGFLGAGAIMQSRASVTGLTTAATIWVVAAIGTCIGAGYTFVGYAFTITVLFTLLAVDRLESIFLKRSGGGHAIEIIFKDDNGDVRLTINELITKNKIEVDDFDIEKLDDNTILRLHYTKNFEAHKRFILDLWSLKSVTEVKQL